MITSVSQVLRLRHIEAGASDAVVIAGLAAVSAGHVSRVGDIVDQLLDRLDKLHSHMDIHASRTQQRHHALPLSPKHVQSPGDIRCVEPEVDGRFANWVLKHVGAHEGFELVGTRHFALQTEAYPLLADHGVVVIAHDLEGVRIEGDCVAVARWRFRAGFHLPNGESG